MLGRTSLVLRSISQTGLNINRQMSSNPRNLQGKVAVVTASTDGIGFAIARRLARDGASVVVSSRKEDNVKKAVDELQKEGLKVLGVPCHVGNADQRAALLKTAEEKFGGLDILVSNAAVNPAATLVLDTPESAWDKIFEINVKCAFLLSKEAMPMIEKRGGGSIIYISSIAGYQAMPLLGAYSVSKTALLGLTRAAAEQCAPYNIRVNCICPGIIKTRFSQLLWEDPGVSETVMTTIPLKRLGEPDDVAGAVSFLASDDSGYITGENIPVAGGFYCKI